MNAHSAGAEEKQFLIPLTTAIHLLLNGADIKRVQEWLGHSSLASTEINTRIAPENWLEYSGRTLERFRI